MLLGVCALSSLFGSPQFYFLGLFWVEGQAIAATHRGDLQLAQRVGPSASLLVLLFSWPFYC